MDSKVLTSPLQHLECRPSARSSRRRQRNKCPPCSPYHVSVKGMLGCVSQPFHLSITTLGSTTEPPDHRRTATQLTNLLCQHLVSFHSRFWQMEALVRLCWGAYGFWSTTSGATYAGLPGGQFCRVNSPFEIRPEDLQQPNVVCIRVPCQRSPL